MRNFLLCSALLLSGVAVAQVVYGHDYVNGNNLPVAVDDGGKPIISPDTSITVSTSGGGGGGGGPGDGGLQQAIITHDQSSEFCVAATGSPLSVAAGNTCVVLTNTGPNLVWCEPDAGALSPQFPAMGYWLSPTSGAFPGGAVPICANFSTQPYLCYTTVTQVDGGIGGCVLEEQTHQ